MSLRSDRMATFYSDCPSIADRRSTPSRADRGVCSGAIASERSSPPSREKGHGGVSELHGVAEVVVRSAGMGAITTRPVSVYTEVSTPVSSRRAERNAMRAWVTLLSHSGVAMQAPSYYASSRSTVTSMVGGAVSQKTTQHNKAESTTPESPRVRVLRDLSTWPSTKITQRILNILRSKKKKHQ